MIPANHKLSFHASNWSKIGDYVRNFMDKRDGTPYIVVVNGDLTKEAMIPVNIEVPFLSVTDLCTGETLIPEEDYQDNWRPIGKPFKQIKVKLQPGSGTLLRINFSE